MVVSKDISKELAQDEEVRRRAKRNKKKPKSLQQKIVFGIVFAFFIVYAIYILTPFAYGFLISLKKNGRAFMNEDIFVNLRYFDNYAKAIKSLTLNDINYFSMLFNSIWYAVGTTVVSTASTIVTGYIFAKYEFRAKKVMYSMILFFMMLPIYGTMAATYRLYTKLGFINSPLILISFYGGFGGTFLYMHGFFKGLSWSYAEAAFIDGAGNFRVFISIMVPMLMPTLSAMAIMAFIGNWNAYETILLYLPKMPNLAAGLYTYEFGMKYTANQPIYFAGVMLSLFPIVTLFLIFQNTIMSKIYIGGLKA